MKFPVCPKDPTHEWHGSTQTLYEKAENTMRKRAVLCTECVAVYVLFKDVKYEKPAAEWSQEWITYARTDAKGIPLPRSK